MHIASASHSSGPPDGVKEEETNGAKVFGEVAVVEVAGLLKFLCGWWEWEVSLQTPPRELKGGREGGAFKNAKRVV